MYHRVHAPVDGRVVAWRYVPGRLFPVNGAGVRSVPGLFTRNERVALFLDTEAHGPVAVVLVGAANVGRMSLAFADLVTNRGRPAGRTVPAIPVAAGARGRARHLQPRLDGGAPARRAGACSPGGGGRSRPHGPGPVAALTVGVVSDTHGLVRPEAKEALRGADVILHAGDIGGTHVLSELGELAPVIAVRGNVDGGWARLLPERRVLDLGGVSVLILHDRALVGADPATELAPDEGLGIVVFGHSHQPLAEKRKGILWFNPGSAGPRRFELPVSVGRLVFEEGRVRHRLITLDV